MSARPWTFQEVLALVSVWRRALEAAQARIGELEAALALRTGDDHDEDCKARRGRLCNCGHDEARRAVMGRLPKNRET